jgi:outer membrane protein insertion porin family/translocation and assembly module TamA
VSRFARIRTRRHVAITLVTLGAALAAAPAAGAQDLECDPGDVEVRRLSFVGNRAFSDATLANSIVTTQSSAWRRLFRLPFTTRRCLDEEELPRDSLRLVLLYTKHGYQDVKVGLQRIPAGVGRVHLRFDIAEGEPVRVDSLLLVGIPEAVDSARLVRRLELRPGIVFDKVRLQAATDTIAGRLRDAGYPQAELLTAYDLDRIDRTASVEFTVLPGPRSTLGDIRVRVDTSGGRSQEIPSGVVRRLSGLEPGDLYSERDLVNAQRNLYRLETYSYVEVQPSIDSTAASDSVVAVDLVLVEGPMHTARVGLGWASFDCFRTQVEYVDRNLGNGARRLELAGRLSKIGVGYPLGSSAVEKAVCGALSEDPFSDTLNYFASATLRQPTLFGLRSIPAVTVFTERRSEFNAYLRETPIGMVVSMSRPLRGAPATYAYQLERGRTRAQPAVLCVVFDRCTSEERRRVTEYQRLAVVSAAWTRNRADNPLNPSAGTALHLEVRHASRAIGSRNGLSFNKFLADAAWYRGLVGNTVLAARVRFGAVLDGRLEARQDFIPPQERLYAGGASTVRGFAQNELGPVVYVVDDTVHVTDLVTGDVYLRPRDGTAYDAVPTGGNTMVVGNLELRAPSPIYGDVAQLTFFTDVGEVWNRQGAEGLEFEQLKWTPGVGLRIFTPFGAFRVDVGYNGYDRPAGPAYFDARRIEDEEAAPLYCASPTNTWRFDTSTSPPEQIQPPGELCPGSFSPTLDRNFFRRLNFSFSLGQAF